MRKYKKIYIEITNSCNLSCSFCAKSKREKSFITVENFKKVLDSIKGYTDYIYLHVLGEPLLHPNINELINIASKDFKINITTNGYLIELIKDNKNIRQLNISLHSYKGLEKKDLDKYLDNVFAVTDILKEHTYISYRLWTNSNNHKYIIDRINKKYNTNIDYKNIKNNSTISKSIFISTHDEYVWPNDSKESTNQGPCYALKDHIGILVDGTVIPCCLDSEGTISLGNIYNDTLSDIIKSEKYQNMLNKFKDNCRTEELCQKCNFINNKNKF